MPDISRSTQIRNWLAGLFLVAATVLAYQPVWHAGFIWDDDSLLTENPLIRDPHGLYRFWCTAIAPDYFPMTSTTLWLEWRLWGENAAGYHWVNLLLHAVSAVVLWRALRKLSIPGAWFAAAIFALHPVNVESVAWIAERKNTLAMFFYCWTLFWFLKSEEAGGSRWYWLSVGTFALALLSKTAVVTLPVALLLLAWWRRGRIDLRDFLRSIPYFGIAAALGLITVWFQSHRAIGSEVIRQDSFWSRLAGAGWAVWFYLYKALLPLNLAFVYPRWHVDPASVLAFIPGLLIVGGFVVLWCFRNRWGRGWLFGLGYFVLMLLPILGLVNIYFMRYSLVADHWQYFAIIGPITLLAAGIILGLRRWIHAAPVLEIVLCGSILTTLAVLTWRESRIYRDDPTLWQATVVRTPGSYLAHNCLGAILLDNGHVDEALAHFRKALEIQPGDATIHCGIGLALLEQGQNAEAQAHFEEAIKLHPAAAEGYCDLGLVYLKEDRLNAAVPLFRKAVELRPEFAKAQTDLGIALLRSGQNQEAIAAFQKVLEMHPNHIEAHYNLGVALCQGGQREAGITQLQETLKMNPAHLGAHCNLAIAMVQEGKATEAAAHFQAAADLQPQNPDMLNNLAWLLATCSDDAVRNGQKALDLARNANQLSSGGNPSILATLAAAYAEIGQFPDAISTAQQARQLAVARNNTALANSLQRQIESYQVGHPFRDNGSANSAVH